MPVARGTACLRLNFFLCPPPYQVPILLLRISPTHSGPWSALLTFAVPFFPFPVPRAGSLSIDDAVSNRLILVCRCVFVCSRTSMAPPPFVRLLNCRMKGYRSPVCLVPGFLLGRFLFLPLGRLPQRQEERGFQAHLLFIDFCFFLFFVGCRVPVLLILWFVNFLLFCMDSCRRMCVLVAPWTGSQRNSLSRTRGDPTFK